MMKSVKQTVSIILAACALLSLLSPCVFAAGSTGIEDMKSQITSTVVAENAIPSATTNCYTFVYNGHDYFAGIAEGGTYIVYDIDAKKLVYQGQCELIATVRGFCLDGYGNLWIYGASYYLYKLNLATGALSTMQVSKPSSNITSFNILGLTWDPDTKMLYCGTYNRGCLLKINPLYNTYTTISSSLGADYMWSGFAGLVVKDGYAYLGADGDVNGDGVQSHHILKVNITTGAIADRIDLVDSGHWGTGNFMLYMKLVGNTILFDRDNTVAKTVAVDISGEKMKLVDLGTDMPRGFTGYVSDPINGKAYCCSSSGGLLEIDIATMQATKMNEAAFPTSMRKLYAAGSGVATIEGDDRLPGTSLVTFEVNEATKTVDLIFYNVQTKQTVRWSDDSTNVSGGYRLNPIMGSPDGKSIYVGAVRGNRLGMYDLATGKMTYWETVSTQIDGLTWYNGKVYSGNYQNASINEIDPVTGTVKTFFDLQAGAFNQARVHTLTAGDKKIFCGTVPDKYKLGGVLAWYDLDTKLTYVAAGPTKEDVYYADTSGDKNSYVWYSAATDEKVTFNSNSSFTGLIKNQSISCILYKNGYIYGCTTVHGGSGSTADSTATAKIFVYDVKAKELVGELNLRQALSGFTKNIESINAVAADPDVDGKFWAVVTGTLVSFTFDTTAKTFSVKEELSVNKNTYDSGSQWHPRSIIFDREYMYVSLNGYGICMLKRDNPKQGYLLANSTGHYEMVLAADGNLYIHNDYDIVRLNTAAVTKTIQDEAAAKKAAAMIDALPATVTLADMEEILAVRDYYESLSPEAKDMVANLAELSKAEAAVGELMKDAAVIITANGVTMGYTAEDAVGKINAAKNGAKIKLNTNLETGLTITVAPGVELDLNGKTLTAQAVQSTGAVIDSVGGGLLKANAENIRGTNDAYLPLWDENAGGYRLCQIRLDSLGISNKSVSAASFWFDARFTNDAAYTYAESMTIGVDFIWDEASETQRAIGDEAFMAKFAEYGDTKSVKVTVTGLAGITGFKLTPVVKAVNVELTAQDLILGAKQWNTDDWTWSVEVYP